MVLSSMYILWILNGEFCRCLLGPLGADLSSSPGYPLSFDLSNTDSGVSKSPTIIVVESKSHFRLSRSCFMYLGAPVFGASIFRIVSSSCGIDPSTIM